VKLVMTLLVRDADDLLSANLDFHMRSGVDHFIVMNNLSTDGTESLLEPYRSRGLVTYLYQPEDTFSQNLWVTQMARLAFDMGADWVINNDADEFWYADGLDLKSALSGVSPEHHAVAADRQHFVPRVLASGTLFAEAMTVRYASVLSPAGKPWPGKVCHRARPDIEVGYGNHGVSMGSRKIPAVEAGIDILHFPMRSYEKFERVVVNGGRASGRNPDRPVQRWQDLYRLWQDGALRAYFDAQVPAPEELQAGLRDGRYVRDERLKAALAGLRTTA
jgi:Glycosyl transferase family 2